MFLQASVILSTGGGVAWSRGGAWSGGGLLLGGCLVPRGDLLPGECLIRWVPGPGGGPGGDPPPPGTATSARGTHPTGMHSCSL